MFMNPESYVALDKTHMRKRLKCLHQSIRRIRDGDRNSMLKGYLKFLDICRHLQNKVYELEIPPHDPGPDYPNYPRNHDGRWLLADIQQAIFQFCKEGNRIVL